MGFHQPQRQQPQSKDQTPFEATRWRAWKTSSGRSRKTNMNGNELKSIIAIPKSVNPCISFLHAPSVDTLRARIPEPE
jgi:hypothetical protein